MFSHVFLAGIRLTLRNSCCKLFLRQKLYTYLNQSYLVLARHNRTYHRFSDSARVDDNKDAFNYKKFYIENKYFIGALIHRLNGVKNGTIENQPSKSFTFEEKLSCIFGPVFSWIAKYC